MLGWLTIAPDPHELVRGSQRIPRPRVECPCVELTVTRQPSFLNHARFWKECEERKPLRDPGFSDFGCWRVIAERPADAAGAVKFFERLMDEQVARLEELLELHEEIAGDDATELADRVSSDDSVAGERRRRQQAALGRELRQTIEWLLKTQKAGNNEDNGQADDNGGHANHGEKPATETAAAPKVAAASAERREPGRAARPVGKERFRDRSPSAEALEIAMLRRLVEQAVDLKVLPDRAKVQARRASESLMSEFRRENAKIEAKCQETQIDCWQEDKGDAADSGVRKSNPNGR